VSDGWPERPYPGAVDSAFDALGEEIEQHPIGRGFSADVVPRAEHDRVCAELSHLRSEASDAVKYLTVQRDEALAELAIWREAAEGHLAELDTLRGEKDRMISLVQASGDPDPLATEWPCRFEDAQRGERCAHVTCRPLP
jgi:hypothetical protein